MIGQIYEKRGFGGSNEIDENYYDAVSSFPLIASVYWHTTEQTWQTFISDSY